MNQKRLILLVTVGALGVCGVVVGVYFKVISEVLVKMILGLFS